MNILFTGGGTAGHIVPALALAEEFKKRDPKIRFGFVSRSGGKENEIIKREDIPLYTINIKGLVRKFSLENFRVITAAFQAKRDAAKIIEEFLPDIVIGTGGYVTWPVISAANERKIPTVIHESNATLGLTTRLLMKKADLVLLGANIKKEITRSVFVGNPLRRGFDTYSKDVARRELGIDSNQKLIVSVGGSIGADKLNRASFELMEAFSRENPEICHLHSTGYRYYGDIPYELKYLCRGKYGCRIVPFIENMARALHAADIVISRCGAMTLSELAHIGVPAILIPSPNVTANHQVRNAEYYSSHGAAVIVEEKDLIGGRLIEEVNKLLFDDKVLHQMSIAMRSLATPDAAKSIVDLIENKFRLKNKD